MEHGLVTPSSAILLGVVDDEICKTAVPSYLVNKIGGRADFSEDVKGSPRCRLCDGTQNLVIQIYCPLDGSKYHRTLYVFCCDKQGCWSKSAGWTVLRQSLIDKQDEDAVKNGSVQSGANWGDDENDWDDGIFASPKCDTEDKCCKNDTAALCKDFINLDLRRQVNDDRYDSFPVCFQHDVYGTSYNSYYINVFDESECISYVKNHAQTKVDETLSSSLNEDDISGFTTKFKIAAETYEPAEYVDKTFHKFSKCTKLAPEQVIRYSQRGSPLLPKAITVVPTPCSCGSKRVYEAQLMPALLPYLKSRNTSVEFSTVLLYTCSNNCKPDPEYSLTEEYAMYLDDPDLSYFKGQK